MSAESGIAQAVVGNGHVQHGERRRVCGPRPRRLGPVNDDLERVRVDAVGASVVIDGGEGMRASVVRGAAGPRRGLGDAGSLHRRGGTADGRACWSRSVRSRGRVVVPSIARPSRNASVGGKAVGGRDGREDEGRRRRARPRGAGAGDGPVATALVSRNGGLRGASLA